jgi:2,3-bisphosphoglycerate-dependent phosphoglycerate mutase
VFKLLLISLTLCNFNAFSQKTNIWFVAYAEADDSTATNKQPGLTNEGLKRAEALARALKHEDIKAIYVTNKKAASQTAAIFAQKAKILPKVYVDSVKGLATKVWKNFQGSNVLIVGRYNTIIPFVEAFGGNPPFGAINNDDYDLLFSVTITNDDTELLISHYGKPHHSTEIPQSFIMDKLSPPILPPIINH